MVGFIGSPWFDQILGGGEVIPSAHPPLYATLCTHKYVYYVCHCPQLYLFLCEWLWYYVHRIVLRLSLHEHIHNL